MLASLRRYHNIPMAANHGNAVQVPAFVESASDAKVHFVPSAMSLTEKAAWRVAPDVGSVRSDRHRGQLSWCVEQNKRVLADETQRLRLHYSPLIQPKPVSPRVLTFESKLISDAEAFRMCENARLLWNRSCPGARVDPRFDRSDSAPTRRIRPLGLCVFDAGRNVRACRRVANHRHLRVNGACVRALGPSFPLATSCVFTTGSFICGATRRGTCRFEARVAYPWRSQAQNTYVLFSCFSLCPGSKYVRAFLVLFSLRLRFISDSRAGLCVGPRAALRQRDRRTHQ
jgi:hypothetical protein